MSGHWLDEEMSNEEMSNEDMLIAVESIKNCLVARATGEAVDEAEYQRLRRQVLAVPELKARLPRFIQTCRSVGEFWGFIKTEFERYHERRDYLAAEFSPLLEDLESGKFGTKGVEVRANLSSLDPLSQEFIQGQLDKCDTKLATEDYDGAITNARTLVEAVLREMEHRLTDTERKPDGDLIKQYKRVQKLLNLDPGKEGLATPLKQVLSGLASVVSGLAGLRNAMSDAHASKYRPHRHHAHLVVNAAKTLADFLFETYEYQRERELLRSSADAENGEG